MKKIIIFFLLFLISIASNYLQYLHSKSPKIGSTAEPFFYKYDDYETVKVSGYLKWNDKTKKPKEFGQFWIINVTKRANYYNCTLLDVWDHFGSSIFFDTPDKCEIEKFDAFEKIAILKIKDSIITITAKEATVVSLDPSETGGMALVPNYKLKD